MHLFVIPEWGEGRWSLLFNAHSFAGVLCEERRCFLSSFFSQAKMHSTQSVL